MLKEVSTTEKTDWTRRLLPLLLGVPCVLALSFLFTSWEGSRLRWGTRTCVRMSLLTASGPFAGVATEISPDGKYGWIAYGIVNLLALFAYTIRPSKATRNITVIGFVLWQVFGLAVARAGV